MDDMLEVKLIIGSTREGRAADLVSPWAIRSLKAREGLSVEVLDLRDWDLPMFRETFATIGNPNDPTFSSPLIKEWNAKIGSGDAYIFLTPEYNHSVPAVLKNAIDSVFVTFGFRNKPFGCVAYSGAMTGGARAVDHLAHIGVEAEMVALRNNLLFPRVGDAFDEAGEPKDPMSNLAMSIFLDDLVWWGDALKVARNQSVLPPAFFRQMAAQAAAGAQGEQLVNQPTGEGPAAA
jgi:NAD(P)H-dependent FMN reductase